MKDEFIAGIFLVGGLGVLITYLLLYVSGSLSRMLKVFTPKILKIWTLSMIITTASVLYIYYYYIFRRKLEKWTRSLFVTSTIVFLISAMLWSVTIRYGETNTKGRDIEKYPLYLTALATIGILISVLYSTNDWLVITAASIIVIHHLLLDAIVWRDLHSKTKLLTV